MRDLIFLSLENWDEVWRRNQFVCAELARRFPDRRILFVGKSLFVPQLARQMRSTSGRASVRRTLRQRLWRVPELPNIWVFNPIKPLPNPLPGARALNENLAARQLRGAAKRAGIENPLLWINPHDSGFLIGKLGERGVVYDITDDWELAELDPAIGARIAALDRELCQRADLTMVCSAALFESRRTIARNLALIPNGVNTKHYARIDELDKRPQGSFNANGTFVPDSPNNALNSSFNGSVDSSVNGSSQSLPRDVSKGNAVWERAWPRPVFGYTGTLHRERIDLDLVVKLARAHPGGSVVLVGPQHWADDSLQRALEENPNLHAPGAVPYRKIPEVMARFDVCIVPHQCSEFVESLNPIKLWEYLAAGRPIVSTDVAGFRDYPELVGITADAPEFIAACRAALVQIGTPAGESLKAVRRAEAANHSWRARVDDILGHWHKLELVKAEPSSQAALEAERES